MNDNSYEIGYGKPPKHTQFQKGRSGNPKGRPKQGTNINSLIKKTLEAKVTVKGPQGRHSMTKIEAGLVQLANKAAGGDMKALKEACRLLEKFQENEPFLGTPTVFQVNFIDPPNGNPISQKDLEGNREQEYPLDTESPEH